MREGSERRLSHRSNPFAASGHTGTAEEIPSGWKLSRSQGSSQVRAELRTAVATQATTGPFRCVHVVSVRMWNTNKYSSSLYSGPF